MESSYFSNSRKMHELENYNESIAVRSRWETYTLAMDPVDFEIVAFEAAGVKTNDTVLDVGTSDGLFLDRLHYEFGHTGDRIGIDVKSNQFLRKNFPHISSELLNSILKNALSRTNINIDSESSLVMRSMQDITFLPVAADMTSIPLKDNSIDKLFSLFMMYHIPSDRQECALLEAKRVLKPDGTFVVTTSGYDNKYIHRQIESEIAHNLKIEKPLRMNMAFTTEHARNLLKKHFNNVYIGEQKTLMVIDSEQRLSLYINSQRSLYNQYLPIPNNDLFENELYNQSLKLRNIIANNGAFYDYISRSILIASDADIKPESTELSLKELLD